MLRLGVNARGVAVLGCTSLHSCMRCSFFLASYARCRRGWHRRRILPRVFQHTFASTSFCSRRSLHHCLLRRLILAFLVRLNFHRRFLIFARRYFQIGTRTARGFLLYFLFCNRFCFCFGLIGVSFRMMMLFQFLQHSFRFSSRNMC